MTGQKHDATIGVPARQSTMGALEYIIGGAAVLISAISLALAISANTTQERLLAASTWPTLQFSSGNRDDEGVSSINLNLQNAGVGPARVRSVQVLYNDQPRSSVRELLDACCGASGKPIQTVTSSPTKVLTAAEGVTFLRFDQSGADPAIWSALNRERFSLRVRACYCSVLDDCWVMDTALGEPTPVDRCPLVPAEQRWQG